MPAIPLDVLVAARQALDLVMSDPGVPGHVKTRIAFTAGVIRGNVDHILSKQLPIDITMPAHTAPSAPPPNWGQVVSALEHAVRFHDQLNPTDIARFKRVLSESGVAIP